MPVRPRYRYLGPIAQGGMGSVELVQRRQGRWTRLYARKRLHPHLRRDPEFRRMFLDEARLAGLVRHPNVVSVQDVGEDHDGPYLILDFVDGVSAARLIDHVRRAGARLPLQVVVRIVIDASRGLHAAHELRDELGRPLHLVHRDISPQNLLIGFDGTVRISDFGIAKALGNTQITSIGLLKGNICYLSPEQLRFEEVDCRADLYALGVTMYELATGERLHPDTSTAPDQILNGPTPDLGDRLPDAPPELVELTFELLAKSREDRPQTAEQVAQRLEEALVTMVEREGVRDLPEFLAAECADLVRQVRREQAQQQRVTRMHSLRRRLQGAALGSALVVAAYLGGRELHRMRLAGTGPGTRGAAPATVDAVFAGAWHTCALRAGRPWCWGKNNQGQLGVGHTEDRFSPTPIEGLSSVRHLAPGAFHGCACLESGAVRCWGRNREGQAGLTEPGGLILRPATVPGAGECLAVSAGQHHTCALLARGTVTCWGTFASSPETLSASPGAPRQVTGVYDAVELVSSGHDGRDFACARLSSGQVACWGNVPFPERPPDEPFPDRHEPVGRLVPDLTDAVALGLGGGFACAIRRGGSVVCWGELHRLSLPGVPVTPLPPTSVAALSHARSLAGGTWHLCALFDGGAVRCLGRGIEGQLGDRVRPPGALGSSGTPTLVRASSPFRGLTVGAMHTCGSTASGVLCWGQNETGQVGDGTKESRYLPTSVIGL